MQVILLQDIDGFGKRGELKNVAEGHARNFLLPRGLAAAATADSQKHLDEVLAVDQRKRDRAAGKAKELAEAIAHHPVVLNRPSADGARLFGSVSARDIAAALAAKGLAVDHRQVEIAEPIRTLGHHAVTVKVGGGQTAALTVTVVAADQA